MVKKRGRKPTGRGRLSWDGRLWDPAGRVYALVVGEVDRAAVLGLLRDANIEVAVSLGSGPLRWLGPDERITTWKIELEPDFHDQPGWQPPSESPGQRPFHAELWHSDDRRLLLLTDRD